MTTEKQGETLMDEYPPTQRPLNTLPLQNPGLALGFTFCKFVPGVVETFIRV